ncbi:hypothetical protein [Maricaulis sp.]|uniref:hypothetical protein n=1 Tax=Maricaulis sp. TaxID=1486257 RepID=UPI002611B705|nr:hypothetical protein [Maricaulis sp.]
MRGLLLIFGLAACTGASDGAGVFDDDAAVFTTVPEVEDVCYHEVRVREEWYLEHGAAFDDAMLVLMRRSYGNPLIGFPFGADNYLHFATACDQQVLDVFDGIPVEAVLIDREMFLANYQTWRSGF